MATVSFAAPLLLLAVIFAGTSCEECTDVSGDSLCYCQLECPQQDPNNSMAISMMATFWERALEKMGDLGQQQQRMMTELEGRLETAFNSTLDELKTNMSVTFKGQMSELENKMKNVSSAMRQLIAADQNRSLDQVEAHLEMGQPDVASKIRCPQNFSYDNNSDLCIVTSNTGANWSVARERCESMGSTVRLAVLDSEEKRRFASGLSRYDYWIGARREGSQFKWLTGEDVTDGWRPRYPDGNGDCLLFYRNGVHINYPCSRQVRYMCELPMM